jgi:DNA modification methylase
MALPSHLDARLRKKFLPQCRLKAGEIWLDPLSGHRVGCLDACSATEVRKLLRKDKIHLALHDPPYNVAALEVRGLSDYMAFSKAWVEHCLAHLAPHAAFYVWLGADQNDGFQPLPDFMLMMRGYPALQCRSFITLRNQRGYGTQKNWMSLRQELLYYSQGRPPFHVQYTKIPKILRGYYKKVGGLLTENLERSRSKNIRAGNVWVDVQQVFYRMQENVPYAYAQKPLAAIERIVAASSDKGATVADFFSHSGTTLLASEILGRRCLTMDKDPIYCELSIRRLEHFRKTQKKGWQNADPFLKTN